MESGICESCRKAPIEMEVHDIEELEPFRVCRSCAHRLRSYSLRPLEYFNLAAIHGPYGLLHDDFYDDRGKAYSPEEPVENPKAFPYPALRDVRSDRERLLDFAMARFWLEGRPEVIPVLRKQDPAALLEALQGRIDRTPNNTHIIGRVYEICGHCLGTIAADWIRDRWENHYLPGLLYDLAFASARCLPPKEGFARVTSRLSPLTRQQLNDIISALSHFHDPVTLEWMETNRERASTDSWGPVAAVSGFSWAKAVVWLNGGRPLSLVALAALQYPYQPAFGVRKFVNRPRLMDMPPLEERVTLLRAYQERDPVPNVRNRVTFLLQAWQKEADSLK